jgi:hypothetical protein
MVRPRPRTGGLTGLSATGESEFCLEKLQLDLKARDAPDERAASLAQVVVAPLVGRVQMDDIVESPRPLRPLVNTGNKRLPFVIWERPKMLLWLVRAGFGVATL